MTRASLPALLAALALAACSSAPPDASGTTFSRMGSLSPDGTRNWRAFPKHVQISCCGNSVCPPIAAALVMANCGHLIAALAEVAA